MGKSPFLHHVCGTFAKHLLMYIIEYKLFNVTLAVSEQDFFLFGGGRSRERSARRKRVCWGVILSAQRSPGTSS
jgi:hypothetical protein